MFFCISILPQNIDSVLVIDVVTLDSIQIIQPIDSVELDTLNQNVTELSFYKSYLEPIIAVASSLLITILLFSIRSKK